MLQFVVNNYGKWGWNSEGPWIILENLGGKKKWKGQLKLIGIFYLKCVFQNYSMTAQCGTAKCFQAFGPPHLGGGMTFSVHLWGIKIK